MLRQVTFYMTGLQLTVTLGMATTYLLVCEAPAPVVQVAPPVS